MQGGSPRGEAGVVLIPKNAGEGARRVKGHRGLLRKQEDQHVPRQRWGGEEECRTRGRAGEVLGEAVR